jgi:hypothetical protein
MGPGGHVRPETHGNLAELAVARGDNAGVLQVNLRQLQRRFGVSTSASSAPRLTITVCRS